MFAPERRFADTAELRPGEEIESARERVKLWHWRARQLELERTGNTWPPPDCSPKALTDLRRHGVDTLDGIVRFAARKLQERGVLQETVDDDFVAKGKAYRELSDNDASELMSLA